MSLPTPPSIVFPIGTIIEDCNAKMKIKKFYPSRFGHSYQVELLHWNLYPPESVRVHLDMDNFWILVTKETIDKIKVYE